MPIKTNYLFLIITAFLASTSRATDERFERVETHMGTRFYVALYAGSAEESERGFRAAFDRVHELDQMLSDYLPDSELNKLSGSAPHEDFVPVSDDLWKVLSVSQTLSQQSDGAFDVTIGPLTKLWRRARRRHQLPPADELEPARQAVGYQDLELDAATKSVRLRRAHMRLDLGGIAKGYAAEQAIRALKSVGIERALVGGSGDIVAGAPPPDASGWRVGIAPLEANQPPSRYLMLANRAVSTSGDFWQFVEIDGVRYSHIVDPRTGLGITRRSSVTVIAPQGGIADATATALSVLGPEKGVKLATSMGVETLVLVQEDDGIKEFSTAGFAAFLEKPE